MYGRGSPRPRSLRSYPGFVGKCGSPQTESGAAGASGGRLGTDGRKEWPGGHDTIPKIMLAGWLSPGLLSKQRQTGREGQVILSTFHPARDIYSLTSF
jgi:hypothetical protein